MRKASMLSARSSATVVYQPTGMPISARRRLSHWLLVSRFWPLVNSLPIDRISVFMRGPPGEGEGERPHVTSTNTLGTGRRGVLSAAKSACLRFAPSAAKVTARHPAAFPGTPTMRHLLACLCLLTGATLAHAQAPTLADARQRLLRGDYARAQEMF